MKTVFMKNFQKLAIAAFVALAYGIAFAGSDPLPAFQGPILTTAGAPSAGTNCIQTITIGGTPTSGTFTLTYKGKTTSAITWSATNNTLVANIDAALEALKTIGTGGVTTAVDSMTAGIGTITVTFTGDNAKLLIPAMTSTSSLTGSSPTLAVAITTAGVTADGRKSPLGTLLIDSTNKKLYINTGTSLNPTWTVVGSQS